MVLQHLAIVGVSAGGPRILKELFHQVPRLNGCIVIIQHMPKFINQSLCRTLNTLTAMDVKLACEGVSLESGIVYLAPSEVHLQLENNQTIHLFKGEKVNFVCPSIDVAMKSVRKQPETQIIGIILTGMGRDGAEGIVHIKKIGGMTIAQDETTSIIYSMPREAQETGCIDKILSVSEIKNELISRMGVINPQPS